MRKMINLSSSDFQMRERNKGPFGATVQNFRSNRCTKAANRQEDIFGFAVDKLWHFMSEVVKLDRAYADDAEDSWIRFLQ